MEHTYTRFVKREINKISDKLEDDIDNDYKKLKKLLKEFDRPFCEGLEILFKNSPYKEELIDSKEKFIFSRLKSIGVSVDENLRKTLLNWLKMSGIPRVDDTTRDRIYQLCFALSIPFEDVDWFFNHVFFQRSFNCHRMEEAIYYYCFKKNDTYEHAQQLISEIKAFPDIEAPDREAVIYTRDIQQQLDHYSALDCYSTDEELKQYFRKNKWAFQGDYMNQSAKENINKLIEKIRGKKSDKEIIKNPKADNFNECGLIIRELLSPNEYDETGSYMSSLDYHDITSISVMMKCIYGRIESKKDIKIAGISLPQKGRRNFPSEKVFSDLIEGGLDTSKNYDAIRKLLILLSFYEFWCENVTLNLNFSDPLLDKLYDIYIDSTNDLLTDSGYDILFEGNSYDALFMICSRTDDPLANLRLFLES